jgi:hypothetical protein
MLCHVMTAARSCSALVGRTAAAALVLPPQPQPHSAPIMSLTLPIARDHTPSPFLAQSACAPFQLCCAVARDWTSAAVWYQVTASTRLAACKLSSCCQGGSCGSHSTHRLCWAWLHASHASTALAHAPAGCAAAAVTAGTTTQPQADLQAGMTCILW